MCAKQNEEDFCHKRVTIMGLGLHGGGVASARFFAEKGAIVTVTDLRSADVLESSLSSLEGLPLRYVLGEHKESDFRDSDLVIKNPDVPANSPYLKLANRIETDLSLFLGRVTNPILAITGTKGKSTVASALAYLLEESHPEVALGGNIGRSPLSFLKDLSPTAPVVIELSSWQLADLREWTLLKPRIAIVTNIMPDHQNRYENMESYIRDKALIYRHQDSADIALFPYDVYGQRFSREARASSWFFSPYDPSPLEKASWLSPKGEGFLWQRAERIAILPRELTVPGAPFRLNMLIAATAAFLFGIPPREILARAATFPGIDRRMAFCREVNGVRFYDDSASTIPEATNSAVSSFSSPVHLIAGGSDKSLVLSSMVDSLGHLEGLYLLQGSASERLIPLLSQASIPWSGPYSSLEEIFEKIIPTIPPGRVLLFSPGCASFGLFRNVVDRGRVFQRLVGDL